MSGTVQVLVATAALILVVTGLTGCQGSTFTLSPANAGKLIGLPDKPAIEKALGRPETTESLANGREVWCYDYAKTKDHPIDFISYLDIVGSDAKRKMRHLVYVSNGAAPVDDTFLLPAVRAPITLEMIRSLRPDQTESEITALFGPPAVVTKKDARQVWQYDAYSHDFTLRTHLDLGFINGKLCYYPIIPDSYLSERIQVKTTSPAGLDISKISGGEPPAITAPKIAPARTPTAVP